MCRRHLVEVQRHLAEIEARGAQVIAVGQGSGSEAAHVARALKLDYPCLGDPERTGYRKLGLARSDWWNLLVQPFLDDPRGAWRNLREANLKASANPRSDTRQLGGVLIVDRHGVARYLYRSRSTIDRPAISELLGALDQLALAERR